jgi:tetraacyldisaccharide 4'-kinase
MAFNLYSYIGQPLELALSAQHYKPRPDWYWRWLWPVSWLYGQMARWLRHRGQAHACKVPIPVISIGNLTAGGTGKTPFTIALAQQLVADGYQVLVLSRGYRSKTTYTPGQALTPDHGDEPYLIQTTVPQAVVWVGAQRATLAKLAATQWPFTPSATDSPPPKRVILLDDGLQHHALFRDLDLILVDAERGLGNGLCLPLGPCREPYPPSTPYLTHYVAVHKALTDPKTPAHNALPTTALPATFANLQSLPNHQHHTCYMHLNAQQAGQALPADWVCPPRVLLIAGIANPTPLVHALKQKGATTITLVPLVDHATASLQDWQHWQAMAAQQGAQLVSTQKDWVKVPSKTTLWPANTPRAWPIVTDLYAELPPTLVFAIHQIINCY